MWDNATDILEGAGTVVVELCIILDDLPSGGLDCNISAEVASVNITARKYGILRIKQGSRSS